MPVNMVEALHTLMSLQRWNFMPRVEIWTEAENAGYVAHLCYALAKLVDPPIDKGVVESLLIRSILDPLRKHDLSDIPRKTLDTLRDIDNKRYWDLQNGSTKKAKELIPLSIRPLLEKHFRISSDKDQESEISETIFSFACKYAAWEECKANMIVYKDEYEEIYEDLKIKLQKIVKHKRFFKWTSVIETENNDLKMYLRRIRNLKFLRRWNRINRGIETSVLAHTFVVSVLALIFSSIEENLYFESVYKNKIPNFESFQYQVLLRSIFHDVPETLTGDVISPVKDKINKLGIGLWEKVEEKFVSEFKDKTPEQLKKEIDQYELFKELSKQEFSVASLVKDCDRIALALECLLEEETGNILPEMANAYQDAIRNLHNSEWISIREFVLRLCQQFPNKSLRR